MKWLHHLLKGVSLTGALFVFQACYGTPRPYLRETSVAPMSFKVVSQETGEPLEGIHIFSEMVADPEYPQSSLKLGQTNADGQCQVEIPFIQSVQNGPFLHFKDRQGLYADKDTVLQDLTAREILIKLTPTR